MFISSKLERLYRKHSKRLFYYCFGLVGDTCKAEEIVQDAFIKYWENRESVRDEYNYLLYIIKHSSLNYLRDSRLEKERMDDYFDNQSVKDLDQQRIVELVEKVRNEIKELPEKCQKIFILKCIEGQKYQEIAEDMGISVNSVKTQVKIAYKKIRHKLHSEVHSILCI